MSEPSTLKKPNSDISRPLRDSILRSPHTFRTAMLRWMRHISHSWMLWAGMTVFTSILTTGATIQKYFLTELGFSSLPALVIMLSSTILLCLLAVLGAKTSDEP